MSERQHKCTFLGMLERKSGALVVEFVKIHVGLPALRLPVSAVTARVSPGGEDFEVQSA